ncbi:YqaE/Pmp3 family membrane protein [Empedobacter brevis]|uniref:Membrane protein n=2 Tax=Empedobacter brevis TaxID=247 RepID=A0A511NDD7_9FLAO|nr:YqaE/Pmp3 family membrane protein [Empedobacter brevis]MDM1071429.1 YqaE/Pmp3 family membrane protein [Empedobacter brevis]QES93734.1 YqaE/Pmp3 family membrane protein [Empedobacter brevis]QHC85584.1 iduronate sulfatase [Empedobacter brevis]GEM50617.1 membrane protein [Empedobacter brevis NBRC 14943 = ATCC 43319]
MIILAVLLPWLSFILRGKIIHGIICLILQITLIGWLPAAIWAVASLLDGRNKARIKSIKGN